MLKLLADKAASGNRIAFEALKLIATEIDKIDPDKKKLGRGQLQHFARLMMARIFAQAPRDSVVETASQEELISHIGLKRQ